MSIWTLNLRHLHAIAQIRARGSVSAAAKAVSLTQPAITQAVAKLEAVLGLPLFERSAAGMASTPAAELFVPRIEAALSQIASSRVTMTQMRALVALADHGSYASAEHATGLSQPSLHRAVNDLGVALRRPLAQRRGKGVSLTEAGRRMARAFRLARAELEAGLSEIEGLKGRETGVIAIGAMPLCRARLLPATIAAFHAAHPALAIRIVEGSHGELVEPLRDGALDLMIGALRDPPVGGDLVQAPLFVDCPVVIGRKDHPLSGGTPQARELAAYPWIMPAPGAPLRLLWQAMFAQAGMPAPAVPIECGSVMTIRQMLMESDFLTLLSPDQIRVELEAGWLVRIGETLPSLQRTIGYTTRTGWTPTRMQQVFVEALTVQAGVATIL